jgi:hypothetical protein
LWDGAGIPKACSAIRTSISQGPNCLCSSMAASGTPVLRAGEIPHKPARISGNRRLTGTGDATTVRGASCGRKATGSSASGNMISERTPPNVFEKSQRRSPARSGERVRGNVLRVAQGHYMPDRWERHSMYFALPAEPGPSLSIDRNSFKGRLRRLVSDPRGKWDLFRRLDDRFLILHSEVFRKIGVA